MIGQGQQKERQQDKNREYELKRKQQALQALNIAANYQSQNKRIKQRQQVIDQSRQQYEEAPARELQMGLAKQKLLEGKMEYAYTSQQKREMEKIQSGISWTRQQVAEGNWTPEQAERAERQLWQKFYGIVPVKRFNDELTPQEMYNQRIVTDKVTGVRAYIDARGNAKPLPGEITIKEFNELYDNVAVERGYGITDSKGNVNNVSLEDVAREVQSRITLYRRTMASASVAQAQKRQQVRSGMYEDPRGPQAGIEYQQKLDEAEKKKPPQIRQITLLVDLNTLGEYEKNIIERFKSPENIDWSWVRKEHGYIAAQALKYIIESGNEQAIANALSKMGII